MDVKTHWEKVYQTKAPYAVSWYRPHLETSIALIERTGAGHSSAIIDVGGGESTLADDLLARGYQNITVLDISETAIDVCKNRMGNSGWPDSLARCRCHTHGAEQQRLRCLARPGGISLSDRTGTTRSLCSKCRAVRETRRPRYRRTFGPEGPMKCSGLDVVRYECGFAARSIRPTLPLG